MKVAQAEDKGIRLSIFTDECGDSPRDWDNLGKIVCFHRRYNLGDKHDFGSPDDFREYTKDEPCLVLPIYMYDHSGITISTELKYPFTDQWDAGQVGWIYVTNKDILKEYGGEEVTATILKQAYAVLQTEVAIYDQFLRGDVYGFVLEKITHCGECGDEHQEPIDSCWGFYGHDWKENGMADHIGEQYEYLLDKLEDC